MPAEPKEERRIWPRKLTATVVCACVGIALGWELLFLVDREHYHLLEEARRANCLSFEKAILLSIAVYADENQSRCPMDSSNPTLLGSMRLLSNVLTSAYQLHCQDDHRPGACDGMDYRKLTTLNISYSYVSNLKWQDTPDSPLIMDRIYTTSKGSVWPTSGNHGDAGGNVGFNDGHVIWQNSLHTALKDKDGKEVVLSP